MIKDKPFVPKYQRIIDDFRKKITNGTLRPGAKLKSRSEIAERYHVTHATVNRAMNELLRAGLLRASQRSGTFVAESEEALEDRVALVMYNDLLQDNLLNWDNARNFFSMYGQLLKLIPEERRVIVNLPELHGDFSRLKSFRRIIWNRLSREDFERAAEVVGDRGRFLLLNRYYPGCSFISIDHRRAAFDLAEHFLSQPDFRGQIGLLDVPFPEQLSERFVWLERRSGFMDACEKHGLFCRVIELSENDYDYNQAQLEEFDSRRRRDCPGLLLSPTKELMGSLLGFWRRHGYRLGQDYFYGDFNNDDSLKNYGLNVPTVSEDYGEIARLAVEHIDDTDIRHFTQHRLLNLG